MAIHIERRQFIFALGGAAVTLPLAARAQQPGKLPTIGFLASGTPSSHTRWVTTFVQRLSELGWIEGRTVAIEVRWAEGRSDHAAETAADFVRLKVDVAVTTGTPTTLAAKQATAVIPIVFVAASDPVAGNLVASLARPGGNITGLSNQQRDLAGKRLELLREVLPGLRRLAILVNVGNSVWFLMGRITSTSSDRRRPTWIEYCAAQSPPICLFSSRASFIWLSTSRRQRHSSLRCRRRCSRWPTR
jgi:putative tryptophan/tyrosine transport system substrate-binding protein